MKGIFHLHTVYSKDSTIKIESLVKFIKLKKIDGICITDHDTFKGYEVLKKIANIEILPGIEIETNIGDIIIVGLEEIKGKYSDYNTIIDYVKSNDGLIVIPHPFDIFRKGVLRKTKNVYFHALEIFNGRCVLDIFNKMAKIFCIKNKKIGIAGSDAHMLEELDNCYLKYEGDFFECIKKGRFENIINKKSIVFHHLFTLSHKLL
ncbi:MAG: PHP domain-containing protein [Candidatus Aenigmatarchaeota archaeon]